jgi:two-component system, OmpR family, sensor histidine kinase SenX3
MDPTVEGLLLTLLGVVIGGVTVLAWRVSERQLRGPVEAPVEAPVVPTGVATVLNVLRSSALVVDEGDRVLQASAAAYALGLVRDGELRVTELVDLVRQVRRDGETRSADLELLHDLGTAPTHVHARVAALNSRAVLVLADDRTRERRVESIRRDFVANVSHELKTPVGALTLLAEAVQEAADDPEAVIRFAGRMQQEATRLNTLVQQIIELSRLQGDEALDRPRVVEVDRVVAKALDASAIEAKAKDVALVFDGRHGLEVLGDDAQITLALSNLVSNAVAFSSPHGSVVVTALSGGRTTDITVTDQGIGIPRDEIDRIFERFYRVDPARHRSTGGTGLGLSIVKHVAASHGGEVRVWSQEGEGSSFTLRLPVVPGRAAPDVPEPEETP